MDRGECLSSVQIADECQTLGQENQNRKIQLGGIPLLAGQDMENLRLTVLNVWATTETVADMILCRAGVKE